MANNTFVYLYAKVSKVRLLGIHESYILFPPSKNDKHILITQKLNKIDFAP